MKIPCLVILLMAAHAAMAQIPGMFPWWEAPIRNDLGLNDEQNRHISTTLRDMRPRMIELRHAVERAETELKEEMDAAQVDLRKANEAIEKVVAARAELTRAVAQMSLKLRLVLTPAQWQELQKRQTRPGGRRLMQRGPGMGGSGSREINPARLPPNNYEF